MRTLTAFAIGVGLMLMAGACSSAGEQAEPTPETPPAATVGATSTPTPSASATPTPTPTPGVLELLAEELSGLGIDEDAVDCIREGLEEENPDQDSLESADLNSVALLDTIATVCKVDLLDYVDE